MKNRRSIALLSILGCIILVGVVLAFVLMNSMVPKARSTPDIKDGGFLSEDPCAAPCFFGIVPNKTTETQAVQILKTNGLYENCYIFNHEDETGLRGAVCSGGTVSVAYFRSTDIVGSIGFLPSQKITVEMVIEKYGEPNAISIASDWPAEGQPTTSMALVYDNIYATIGLGEQEGNAFQLTPATLIESIGYSDPTFPSVEEHEFGISLLSSWHGYGEYRDVSSP